MVEWPAPQPYVIPASHGDQGHDRPRPARIAVPAHRPAAGRRGPGRLGRGVGRRRGQLSRVAGPAQRHGVPSPSAPHHARPGGGAGSSPVPLRSADSGVTDVPGRGSAPPARLGSCVGRILPPLAGELHRPAARHTIDHRTATRPARDPMATESPVSRASAISDTTSPTSAAGSDAAGIKASPRNPMCRSPTAADVHLVPADRKAVRRRRDHRRHPDAGRAPSDPVPTRSAPPGR